MSEKQKSPRKGNFLSRRRAKSLASHKFPQEDIGEGTMTRSKKRRAKSLKAKFDEETTKEDQNRQDHKDAGVLEDNGALLEKENAPKSKMKFKDKFKNRLSQRKSSKEKRKGEEESNVPLLDESPPQTAVDEEVYTDAAKTDKCLDENLISPDVPSEIAKASKKVQFLPPPNDNEHVFPSTVGEKESNASSNIVNNTEQIVVQDDTHCTPCDNPSIQPSEDQHSKMDDPELQKEHVADIVTHLDTKSTLQNCNEMGVATVANETEAQCTKALTESEKSGVDTESTVDLDGITAETDEQDVFNEAISDLMTQSSLKSSFEFQSVESDDNYEILSNNSVMEKPSLQQSSNVEKDVTQGELRRGDNDVVANAEKVVHTTQEIPESLEGEPLEVTKGNAPVLYLHEEESGKGEHFSSPPSATGRNTCETLEEKPLDWEYVEHPSERSTEHPKTLRKMAMGKLYQNMRMSKTYCACCSLM